MKAFKYEIVFFFFTNILISQTFYPNISRSGVVLRNEIRPMATE